MTINTKPLSTTISTASSFSSSVVKSSSTSKLKRVASTAATSRRTELNNCIVSIAEGRGAMAEIGIALFNINSSECCFMQHADTQTFTKTIQTIVVHQPMQILLPENTLNGRLYSLVAELFQDIELVHLKRSAFNSSIGFELAQKYSKDSMVLEGKYFALSALSALFQYLEEQRISLHQNVINVEYKTLDGILMMGLLVYTRLEYFSSIMNLELVSSAGNSGHNHSLLATLNHCKTQMGTRLLRMNIVQPLTDISTIEQRLNAVVCLMESPAAVSALGKAIKSLPDLDRIICSIVRVPDILKGNAVDNYLAILISFRDLLSKLPRVCEVSESLDLSNSIVLESIFKVVNDHDLELVSDHLSRRLADEADQRMISNHSLSLFALKAETNSLLHIARQTYNEIITDINNLVKSYCEQFDFNIKLVMETKKFAFHLQVSTKEVSEPLLPSEFVNRKVSKKYTTFTSVHLLKLNERLQESANEIIILSQHVCLDTLQFIRGHIKLFYKVAEAVGLLDMLLSFSIYSKSLSSVCRPEFTDTLAIKKGRHPMKEKIVSRFIPNDVYMYTGCNFQIITGPNMSGKSTFLKQVALLTILSQIGCMVPAAYASVRITNHILTRIGDEDTPAVDLSGFSREMSQMAYVLENVSDNSLIVIDELGRGTALYDGLSISCAISEELLKTKAFTFFATHFFEVAEYLDAYPNVVNLHLQVDTSKEFEYLYKVETGISAESHYGLQLAQAIGYPSAIISNAREMAARHKQLMKQNKEVDPDQIQYNKKKKLFDRLVHIANSACVEGKELQQLLKGLQEEYKLY